MNTESKLISALGGIVDIQKFLVGIKPNQDTIGERIVKSDNLDKVLGGTGQIMLKLQPYEVKTAIVSTGAINDPLVPPGTPTLDYGARRTLFLRDLLPSFPISQGAVEIPISAAKICANSCSSVLDKEY